MKIKLYRRHGRNQAGKTYDYPETMGRWLVDRGFGTQVRAASGPAQSDETPAGARAASRRKTTGAGETGASRRED